MKESRFQTKFGDLVKKYRNNSGLTQREFSKVLGISRTTISNLETGKFKISFFTGSRVIVLLQIPLKHVYGLLKKEV